jgi:hypothetical protein
VRAAADEIQHEEAHHLLLEEADLEHPPLEVEQEGAVAGQDRGYLLVPTRIFSI